MTDEFTYTEKILKMHETLNYRHIMIKSMMMIMTSVISKAQFGDL